MLVYMIYACLKMLLIFIFLQVFMVIGINHLELQQVLLIRNLLQCNQMAIYEFTTLLMLHNFHIIAHIWQQ